MTHRSRSLTDWLLLRAWIEPDHEHKLRVVVRAPAHEDDDEPESQQAFADADGAANYVRSWLLNFVRRWEGGERWTPRRRWGPSEPDDAGEGEDEPRDGD